MAATPAECPAELVTLLDGCYDDGPFPGKTVKTFISLAGSEKMKQILPFAVEGVCYAGYRGSGKLPKRGWIHINQVDGACNSTFHVVPYKTATLSALCDLMKGEPVSLCVARAGNGFGSDGAVANASCLLALMICAVGACSEMVQLPKHVLEQLAAIQVWSLSSTSSLTRVVQCMTQTAHKAKQHVGLDPLLIASMVENLGAVASCSTEAERMGQVKKIKEQFNAHMVLNKSARLEGSLETIVSKCLTAPRQLLDQLRCDCSEFSFSGPFSYGLFSFAGFWPGHYSRDVAHAEWKQLFQASLESSMKTREHVVGKFKSSGKALSVAEAILACKRFVLSETIAKHILDGKPKVLEIWRREVDEGRHNASLEAMYTHDLQEDWTIRNNARESLCTLIPGLRSLLMNEMLQLEASVSADATRPNSAASFHTMVEAEWKSYQSFFGDLAQRFNQSIEAQKAKEAQNQKELKGNALAHLFGVSDDGDEAQVDQNAVRGGLARCHVMPSADLPVRGPLLAQQFLRRWCAERNLNGESVASLVICDYSGKSKLGAAHVTNVATFFANLAWPKLVFPPDVTGQAGNKSVGEDGGNADGKEREASEEDSDDGELPAEAVSLPTSGLICNPQKKRRLELQEVKRSLRDKCRGGNHVDEDFTFIFNSAANKRTCVGGFSLELIQTTDGQDVHEWLARTPLGTGHCGPFNRPDNLISTGKSAAEAARATGAVKKVPSNKASSKDRVQKGPDCWAALFQAIIDGLSSGSRKFSGLVICSLGGVGDIEVGLLKACQKKAFPCGLLYLEPSEKLKGITRARLFELVTGWVMSGELKITGYTYQKTVSGLVNAEVESQEFSRSLKFLSVSSQAKLVVPSDDEISGAHSSAAIYKLLDEIRKKSEKMQLQGIEAAPVPDSQPGRATALRFSSLEEFKKGHQIVISIALKSNPAVRIIVHQKGLALHASSKAMVDGPIFGCGHASVVPEVEAGKYGDTKEIAWTRTGNAASLPVIVNERMSTVLEELQKVQWDTSRPDLAIYGHHGTLTASNQLMLKPRLGMVAKCEAKPAAGACTVNNVGLLVNGKLSRGVYTAPVVVPVKSPQGGCYLMPQQRSVIFWYCADKLLLEAGEVILLTQ